MNPDREKDKFSEHVQLSLKIGYHLLWNLIKTKKQQLFDRSDKVIWNTSMLVLVCIYLFYFMYFI